MKKVAEGILVINKPKGLTSHDVVARVRRTYGVKKVGHAGTLDPLAEGVLIVLVGQATKRQSEFMEMEKEYKAEITFGAETDTYDSEGKIKLKVKSQKLKLLSEEMVRGKLQGFMGEIEQTVPPYSAVKVGGKKLYQLARRGKISEVKLPKRKVTIYNLELLDFRPLDPRDETFGPENLPKAKLRIVCSRGTYIRSLAYDLGRKLGCGAFLSGLVRTRVGRYSLAKALTLTFSPDEQVHFS